MPTITYTLTDEAPALATYSLLPLIRPILSQFDLHIEKRDISLAARILAAFPEYLEDQQKQSDDLAYLSELVGKPSCCLIKLPNISASVTQLKEAIQELQSQGYKVPDFPEKPKNPEEQKIKARYQGVLGSAVNPKLRDGNADRRIPQVLKELMHNPPQGMRQHKLAPWSLESRSTVMSMPEGDFYDSQQTYVASEKMKAQIIWKPHQGAPKPLGESIWLATGDIIDSSFMDLGKLNAFFALAQNQAKERGLLYSLHLKATMMKVSDPVIFGVALKSYFSDLWQKYEGVFSTLGVLPRLGLQDLLEKIKNHPEAKNIQQDIQNTLASSPVAMVDSDQGITNFHVPSHIIIDASMATLIRDGGQMWNKEGQLQDAMAVIPDRTYAWIYAAAIDFCKTHGAMDPKTMGSLANVGLMAGKAQEYGSHPRTFICESDGVMEVQDHHSGEVLLSHQVSKGDIWRMCYTQHSAIKSWVKLACDRTRLSPSTPTIFWLDPLRPHDRAVQAQVEKILAEYDEGLPISFSPPGEAMYASLTRLKKGENIIAATGNVLRDYLTDLFPILEVGTSAKMLSIVSLNQGGGLFETGSGGSAPKHVQQFHKENHLRWDSLGEFLALGEALDFLQQTQPERPHLLALSKSFRKAQERYLREGKSPSRKAGELDSRGSHFYFVLFLVEALAQELKESAHHDYEFWQHLAGSMKEQETQIISELTEIQGKPLPQEAVGGYYHLQPTRVSEVMRSSKTLGSLWDQTFQNSAP